MTPSTDSSTATPQNRPEWVLCISRSEYERRGAFSGFQKHDNENWNIGALLSAHPDEERLSYFTPRAEAETSPTSIQVIPYIVLEHGGDIFTYSRNKNGGEARLHDQLSIGIGGHINDQDSHESLEAYLLGTIREIQEEVGLDIPLQAIGNTAHGLLHDPNSEVGRVHIGVLHVLHISGEQMSRALANAESSMSHPRLVPVHDLMEPEVFEQLESWSQWALEHFVSLLSKPKPWEDKDFIRKNQLLNMAACEVGRSSSELSLQERGPQWQLARKNLETAIGGLVCMISQMCDAGTLSAEDIEKASIEFRDQIAR